ncbi:hypothetical protein TRVL_04262 [Trypanosoma vivax]|nr:hypothetical protein TRVL_04262 [Trypanosoma vivax]
MAAPEAGSSLGGCYPSRIARSALPPGAALRKVCRCGADASSSTRVDQLKGPCGPEWSVSGGANARSAEQETTVTGQLAGKNGGGSREAAGGASRQGTGVTKGSGVPRACWVLPTRRGAGLRLSRWTPRGAHGRATCAAGPEGWRRRGAQKGAEKQDRGDESRTTETARRPPSSRIACVRRVVGPVAEPRKADLKAFARAHEGAEGTR